MSPGNAWRDPTAVRACADAIQAIATRQWTLMEVCGGQTHAILRHALDELLPPSIRLIHGPGCPVCVTPAAILDQAQVLATRPEVTLCTFADMLRVPGNQTDLDRVRAAGADVRSVLSPLDALALARATPAREIVFLAVGFETTAPATALAIAQAAAEGVGNFSVLTAHVRVPPALAAILATPDNQVQGFLAAGHVCAVMGLDEYIPLARRFGVPIVVAGFEPLDILEGVRRCIAQLEAGVAEVENAYTRAVQPQGNRHAQRLLNEVFTIRNQAWRGLGDLPEGGLGLQPRYATFDAGSRFGLIETDAREPADSPCVSGAVLTGRCLPTDCPAFGKTCTPTHPLGAPMVSSEGACAAYFRFRNTEQP